MAEKWLSRARSLIRWGKAAKIFFWTVISVCLPVALFLAGLLVYINYWHYDFDEKLVDEFLNYKPPLVTEILDRNGETLIELPGIGNWQKRIPEYRRWVKFEDTALLMRNAVLAAEDQHFFKHDGLDYIPGMVRALGENAIATGRASYRAGKLVMIYAEGASTLTQQAIELTILRKFHERELRSELSKVEKLKDKIDKMRLAVWLEEKLTKRLGSKDEAKKRIFEIVANVSYCGHGQYGVASASRFFFGKELSELTPTEAATIAGLFRSPEKYSPYRHGVVITARRNGILKVMADWGYISKENLREFYTEPLLPIEHKEPKTEAPAVIQHVLRSLWSLPKQKGIYWENGVTVKSTVDKGIQRLANFALEYGLNLYRERQRKYSELAEKLEERELAQKRAEKVQGAVVVIQNGTGEILAMVGGASNDYISFNRATEAMRQPGSAFKIVVYSVAVEQGRDKYKIDCLREGKGECQVMDVRGIQVPMGSGKAPHKIGNYDDTFYGKISIWLAFARSQNAAAVWLAKQIGVERIVDLAHRLGLNKSIEIYPTTAIGAEEVTVLELAAAFATFPNGGYYIRPTIILEVKNDRGEVTVFEGERRQVFDKFVADEMVELMRHTVLYRSGTGRRLNEKDYPVPVAGKTGTTNRLRDVWFGGYTYGDEGITILVWMGMDDATPLMTPITVNGVIKKCEPRNSSELNYCEAGGKTALPITKYFFQEYYKEKTPPQFPEGMDEWIRYVHEYDRDPTR